MDAIGLGASNNRADLEEALARQSPRSGSLPVSDPGANLGEPGSGEPAPVPAIVPAKRGTLTFFTADEVLRGWLDEVASQTRTGSPAVGQVGPTGYQSSWKMKRPEGGGAFALDVQWLKHLKVEQFFLEHPRWVMSKPFLLLSDWRPGCGLECRLAFESWYGEHPLAKVYNGEIPGRAVQQDMIAYPLKEAVDRYNERAKKGNRTTYAAARKASQPWKKHGDPQPRLAVTRPEGRVHTTVWEITRWIEGDKRRKSAESCDEAA